MKTAIASATNKAEGEISEKGGRAPYYLIFDEENKLIIFLCSISTPLGCPVDPEV